MADHDRYDGHHGHVHHRIGACGVDEAGSGDAEEELDHPTAEQEVHEKAGGVEVAGHSPASEEEARHNQDAAVSGRNQVAPPGRCAGRSSGDSSELAAVHEEEAVAHEPAVGAAAVADAVHVLGLATAGVVTAGGTRLVEHAGREDIVQGSAGRMAAGAVGVDRCRHRKDLELENQQACLLRDDVHLFHLWEHDHHVGPDIGTVANHAEEGIDGCSRRRQEVRVVGQGEEDRNCRPFWRFVKSKRGSVCW